uniref:VPS10 domain-containing protein n=1 Tax=Euplotes crassus TaxID=5936 RepID=A0A7S3KHT3_EUPCR|mmetsp:Transcript_24985/g.24721  ORF Transcript_24985/g.24721 Transcript_24985/m.24721 type:complete len:862 (+) Transcript_24985:247-2832(+)
MAPANTKRDDEKSASIKKKSQITESEITRMHWCGESTNIILGQTIKGQIYRSVDRGETWEFKHDYEKLDGAGQLDKKNVKKATKIADIVESPVDSNLVFLIGASGVNWVSEDCGANFKPLNNGRKISQLKFHPTQRNWAMASIFTSCEDFDEDDEPCKIYREVYYTQDLGEHWNFLKDYVLEFEWGKGSADDQVPEELIFLMVQKNTVGHLDPDTWASGNTLISSTDFFRTSRTVVKGANRFAMMTEYIYVARALKNGEIDLVMSERANKFATFHKVKFPNKNTYKSFEYNLMESWSGAVFLFINLHTGSGVQYGNVYMSDASGKGFSLTLARVPLGTSGYADIEEVNSVEGVIIANKYSKSAITKMNKDTTNSAESTGVLKKLKNKAAASTKNGNKVNSDPQEMAQAIRDAKTEMATKKNPEIPIKTYISLNRGGNWQLLNAPEQTAKGKKINCKAAKGCSLHLHSYSSPNFPVPYAHNNAVGLIMGVGNLGTQLKYDMEEVNTYLSRDGGLTWLEIMNGPHILEFGDHGGIIVMAPLYKPTKTVLYSWNEGKTWVEYKISNTLLNIDAIEVEPTSKAMHFVLSARRAKTSKSKGVIFTIDFTDLHQPSCQGVTNPDTKDSDYETWTPYDGRHGDKCFLGRKITYVRRKRDSECYNPEEKEAVLFQENCPCTENDFECDFGYKRTESGQCEAAKSKTYEPPEDCSGYYSISKGYRRIPGNTCDGGGEYDPIQIACPGTWSIFSIRTLIILFLIGVAYYVVAESEWFVLVVDWINDKYSAIMNKNNDPYKYSKELGHNPDTAGDSDDDEKIVSKEDPSSSINQRGRADIEMKEDVKDSQNLIDINKYQDSDEDDDKQKIIQ